MRSEWREISLASGVMIEWDFAMIGRFLRNHTEDEWQALVDEFLDIQKGKAKEILRKKEELYAESPTT